MFLFDYLLDNTDALFFTFFVGSMTGAFIKATFFPTTQIPVNTIETPTLHYLAPENLHELRDILEMDIDTGIETVNMEVQTIPTGIDQAIQTEFVGVDQGVQIIPTGIDQGVQVIHIDTSVTEVNTTVGDLINLNTPVITLDAPVIPNLELIADVDQGIQRVTNPMFGKDWNTIIEYINNKPSFFFDAPGCDTWIIPDPSVLTLISNSQILPLWT